MNSQRRAFLLFLLLAVTFTWSLSLAGQRRARAMQRSGAKAQARGRYFELGPQGAWQLMEPDASVARRFALDARAPNWIIEAEEKAADAPGGDAVLASTEQGAELLLLRLGDTLRLLDAGLKTVLEFKLPAGTQLRGGFRLSPARERALATAVALEGAAASNWLFSGGRWVELALPDAATLADGLKVSSNWEYLGFEARSGAGEVITALSEIRSLAWKTFPLWSLVGIDDDGTAHMASADSLKDLKISPAAP